MDQIQTQARAREVVEALSDGRYREFFDAMAEDVETTFIGHLCPVSGTYVGKAARKELGKKLLEDIAEIRLEIDDVIAKQDKAVVLARGFGCSRRLRMPYNNSYALVLEFEDGLVKRWTEYLDTQLVTALMDAEAVAREQEAG